MRLWSLHPSYLDAKGIVALWREGLLARAVLMGQTKGYTNHPQLARFKTAKDPLAAINAYLEVVAEEAAARGYSFDTTKIALKQKAKKLPVTDGQVAHEMRHLQNKLSVRDPERLAATRRVLKVDSAIRVHPLFRVVPGGVEGWEKL